eukprot:CAMPEP_0197706936 /NCGR_PEP_ID=MMETSP1338-20131121/127198_1 /TAXON_ID=43686 ORGANISM="Pelagodinium beii, Strain RCC1491" /NCGR_SAMPLE_ID=MMETSP1338 /ASSEMBLY_ACC=CAM_ASM_000754 /LENGTH=260 /DNA_ID=CAMNT_0043290855 /DNA_START=774 /DNA_END=1556 /DNA_ORIENTATION=-
MQDVFYLPYASTVYRMAPYAAGLCGGIAVKEQASATWSFRSNVLQSILTFLSVLTLVIASLVGGDIYAILAEKTSPTSRFVHVALILQCVLLRPCVGLAASFLLYLCAIDRAPRLQAFLGSCIWSLLAGLSYSMYLLQYCGMALLLLPIYEEFVANRLGSSAGTTLSVAFGMPVLVLLGTLPLALLNFLFVERAGSMLSKYFLSDKDKMTSGTDAKAAPWPPVTSESGPPQDASVTSESNHKSDSLQPQTSSPDTTPVCV